jgi:hypothetical protein
MKNKLLEKGCFVKEEGEDLEGLGFLLFYKACKRFPLFLFYIR